MSTEMQTTKTSNKQGSIYILSNPAFGGLLKIGFTTKKAKERAKSLYQTGVPDKFTIEYEGSVMNAYHIEQQVHRALNNYRYKSNREFFKCDLTTAINAIHSEAKKIGVSVVNTLPQTYTSYYQEREKEKGKNLEVFEVFLFMTTLPLALWYLLHNPMILDSFNRLLLTIFH